MVWYGLAKDTTSKLVILNGDSVLLVCHRTIQSRVAAGALESVISGVFDGWWHDLTWRLYRCIAPKILQIILWVVGVWVVSVPVIIQPLQVEMDDSSHKINWRMSAAREHIKSGGWGFGQYVCPLSVGVLYLSLYQFVGYN